MRRRWVPGIALALMAAAPLAPAAEPSVATPLSRGFGTSALGGSIQAPSLWYYGPSYSAYYDRLPAGVAYTGPAYRPSPSFDAFYGPDYLDRARRGYRFDR